MKKKKTLSLSFLIFFVGFIVYNLCVFLFVKDYDNVFFCVYIFTIVAFVARLVEITMLAKANSDGKFLSITIPWIGNVYFAIQFIAGFICIITPIPFKIVLIIQTIVLASYTITMLIITITKNKILNNDEHIRNVTGDVRRIALEAEHLYLIETNEEKKAELKKLYEIIRYSDPISNCDEVCELNKQIETIFNSIQDAIAVINNNELKNKVKSLCDLVEKRNLVCKSKH